MLKDNIELNGKTATDELLKLHILPQTLGEFDFTSLIVTFTDINDENNYFEVKINYSMRGSPGNGAVYCSAAALGQAHTGLEGNLLHINNGYGAAVVSSFAGTPTSAHRGSGAAVPIADQPLVFSFDNATRCVYVCGAYVIDLDDPNYFARSWNGFSSGLVRISVRAATLA